MKKLLLTITLITLVAFGAEPSTVTFSFNDGTILKISNETLTALERSEVVYNLLQESQETNQSIELPFSRKIFNIIVSYLLLDQAATPVAQSEDTTPQEKNALQNVLDTVDTTDLAQVIKAADFLNIPQLVEAAINALLSPHHAQQFLEQTDTISALDEIRFLEGELVPMVLKKSQLLFKHLFTTTPLAAHTFREVGEPFALSGDGSVVACVQRGSFITGPSGDTIVTLSTQTFQELSRIPTEIGKLKALTLSDDGALLAVCQTDSNTHAESILVYNSRSGQVVSHIRPAEKLRFGPTFSSNASLISGVSRNKLCIWNTTTGDVTHEIILGADQPIKIVHHTLITHNQTEYRLYDLNSGGLMNQFEKGTGRVCSINKERSLFAQTLDATTVGIYQLDTSKLVHRLETTKNRAVLSCAFSSDGSLFACISSDGTLEVFKTSDGSLLADRQEIAYAPYDKIVVSDTGEFAVIFSSDGCVIVSLTNNLQRTISFGAPGAIKSIPLVHSSPIAGIVATFNPQSVVYCSLNRLDEIIQQVKQLPLTQLVILNALLIRDKSVQLSEDHKKIIRIAIEPLDQTVKDLFLKLLMQNNGSNRAADRLATDENNHQQSNRSFLGTLIHWLKRAVSE